MGKCVKSKEMEQVKSASEMEKGMGGRRLSAWDVRERR